MDRLMQYQSWRLERISVRTYPQDITVKLNELSGDEADAIQKMIRSGTCFRCRIGRGRWFFAVSVDEAIALAVNNERSQPGTPPIGR